MSTVQSMFKTMAVALAGMVLVYFGVGSILADRWQVDTYRTIGAEPERVRALVGDFHTWAKWSSMDATLGPQTARAVTGEPSTAGHRITWSGSQGKATLTISKATADGIDYEFHSQGPHDAELLPRGKGRVAWTRDGTGSRVHWHDESTWDSLPGR
jgi:hypothetical protein